MKVYETQDVPAVPATTRKVCVRRKCDLCGVESRDEDWDGGRFEVKESEVKVTVMSRTGMNYPEGADGITYEVDICPKCFADRLVPWLRSEGADIEPVEWGW